MQTSHSEIKTSVFDWPPEQWLAAIGGEWKKNGKRWRGTCPACGRGSFEVRRGGAGYEGVLFFERVLAGGDCRGSTACCGSHPGIPGKAGRAGASTCPRKGIQGEEARRAPRKGGEGRPEDVGGCEVLRKPPLPREEGARPLRADV